MKKELQSMGMDLFQAKAQADHDVLQTRIVGKFIKIDTLLAKETMLAKSLSDSMDKVNTTQHRAREKMNLAKQKFKDGYLEESEQLQTEANWLFNDARIHVMMVMTKKIKEYESFIKDNPNKIIAIFPQPK